MGNRFQIELAPPPGLNSDDTSFDRPGQWIDASNIRWGLDGKPETLGYVIPLMTGGAVQTAPNALGMFAMNYGASVTPALIIGTDTKLYVANTSVGLNDVTPASAPTSIRNWSFAAWGNQLLACPTASSGSLGLGLFVTDLSTPATLIATAPAVVDYMLVTPERQVLAFSCSEEVSGTYNPLCIRGSDLEDYTSWTASTTNNAFEHILTASGKIVGAKCIGGYVAVWTTSALFMGQFIGDPSQTYRFDLVAEGCGMVAPNAAAVLNGVAYWMTRDHNFMRWAPGALPEELPCPISAEFRANIVTSNTVDQFRTYAVTNGQFNEVWWFYQDLRDNPGRRYIAYSARTNGWFRGQLDRWAAFDAPFLYYPTFSINHARWRPFIAVDGSGNIYSHEYEGGAFTSVAVSVPWFVQAGDQYMSDGRVRVMVQRMTPDFKTQTADVSVTFYTKDFPQSTAVTQGPYTLTAGAEKKDFLFSGMTISVKFSGTGQWRMGKPVFDAVTMGER
jgi:hypothetical protein